MTEQEAAQVIDAIGASKLAAHLGLTLSAISQWKRNGIPRAQERYLRLVFPHAFLKQEKGEEK